MLLCLYVQVAGARWLPSATLGVSEYCEIKQCLCLWVILDHRTTHEIRFNTSKPGVGEDSLVVFDIYSSMVIRYRVHLTLRIPLGDSRIVLISREVSTYVQDRHSIVYMHGRKFGGFLFDGWKANRQTAKFKSPPNFPVC